MKILIACSSEEEKKRRVFVFIGNTLPPVVGIKNPGHLHLQNHGHVVFDEPDIGLRATLKRGRERVHLFRSRNLLQLPGTNMYCIPLQIHLLSLASPMNVKSIKLETRRVIKFVL